MVQLHIPFPTVTADLPFPPSFNRLWRYTGKCVILTPEYMAWKREAWAAFRKQYPNKMPATLKSFRIDITLDEGRRSRCDGDNRIKPVIDFCQRINLIFDDRDCDAGSWRWGHAPMGCRVSLEPSGLPSTGFPVSRSALDARTGSWERLHVRAERDVA